MGRHFWNAVPADAVPAVTCISSWPGDEVYGLLLVAVVVSRILGNDGENSVEDNVEY